MGSIVGAGIFVMTGIAARDAGPAIAISFFIDSFACILSALCYSEFAARHPVRIELLVSCYSENNDDHDGE